ncbi:four-carbon acid sugar kinase family protein [Namhaeicola litoreus]|uniref:Four-carbon acid sugar kinase family protein n=1 Tax=Namhaeicola litoreus TaxID=1052145 RepID=A0ABW3Y5Q5_9FLAO
MLISLKHISKTLPKEDTFDYRSLNQDLFLSSNKTVVVIDDDPTGNQTVYDVPLLAKWDLNTLINEFENETSLFFLLTNSRSLTQEQSSELYRTISKNILRASEMTGRDFVIISRCDSTLRGHFSEIEVIEEAMPNSNSIKVFIPIMFEGRRVTVDDTHYISEDEQLIPVNETAFSKDHTFAYANANLKLYIEEKTLGKTRSSDVISLDIESIRTSDTQILSDKINTIETGKFCFINALNYFDLDKAINALKLAEKSGKRILFRTSSSFIPSYIGLKPQPLLAPKLIIDVEDKKGGLIIIGSYVPKSSIQLAHLFKDGRKKEMIEVDGDIITSKQTNAYLSSIIKQIDKNISSGKDVVIYTSRKLIQDKDTASNIEIASLISQSLVTLMKGISVRPRYVLAKGGITSHDLAIKGLGMQRSTVLGQILQGIPVWKMGPETKFPGLTYIVFPGNVGKEESLTEIIQKLSSNG